MCLVNGYIIYNLVNTKKKKKKVTHYQYLNELQRMLSQATEEDFTEFERPNLPVEARRLIVVTSTEHELMQSDDKRESRGVQRIRQRSCKVCSVYKGEKRRGNCTTYYCPACSASRKGGIYLCNVARGHPHSGSLTCHQIWHQLWHNGEFKPTTSNIRDRPSNTR
jgi:hypothetical protein